MRTVTISLVCEINNDGLTNEQIENTFRATLERGYDAMLAYDPNTREEFWGSWDGQIVINEEENPFENNPDVTPIPETPGS